MKRTYLYTLFALFSFPIVLSAQIQLDGQIRQWHKITLTFTGPQSGENSDPNPFTDYRLNVTFQHEGRSLVVPGYFAADGDAGETGSNQGNKWRVHFAPDEVGTWTYKASFRNGHMVAISDNPSAGTPVSFDGASGQFQVLPSNKTGKDMRAKGRLEYVDENYLRYAGTGEYFIKLGSNSPENFLAYEDFDNTTDYKGFRKSWEPHVQDWNVGDPTWKEGKGKGILGAVNYLSEQGQNSFAMLVMTIDGDDRNVYPFVNKWEENRTRYDCSKLDQWEVLFSHADKMGMHFTLTLQENENNHILDNGNLGPARKLYYRELIARFGHHLGLTWNIGEENTNSNEQRLEFAQFFQTHDPYKHPLIVHTYVYRAEDIYSWLLDNDAPYSGPSIQSTFSNTHRETKDWVKRSNTAGHPWTVYADEQGPPQYGVPTDGFEGSPSQDDIRANVLWGNLMAGGAGTDYYFGYRLEHDDLTCQNFRPWSNMWAYNRHALHFFHSYLPFHEMQNQNGLIDNLSDHNGKFCLAKPGEVYAIFTRNPANQIYLDLGSQTGSFSVDWFDPRTGGLLQKGTVTQLDDVSGKVFIGLPPSESDQDWVALIRTNDNSCPAAGTPCNDEDPNTENDVEDGNCQCAGSPIIPECEPAGTPCNDNDPETENDEEDGNCNCEGTPIHVQPPGTHQNIWIEAECASSIGNSWKIVDESDASFGRALRIPSKITYSQAPSTANRHMISFSFTVENAGTFQGYFRSISKGPNHDSFWVKLDDGPWALWEPVNNGVYNNNYQWSKIDGKIPGSQLNLNWSLQPGTHQLFVSISESNIWLDKVFFTTGSQTPTGYGNPDPQCGGTCAPAGTPCNDGNPDTENDVENGQCDCEGEEVESPPPGGDPTTAWHEAECAEAVGSTWKIVYESDVSNGQALRIPPNSSSLDGPSSSRRHQLAMNFTAVEAGEYQVFLRSITKGPNHDSFWFRIDDGPWALWDEVNDGEYSNDYQWDVIEGNILSDEQPVSFDLDAGFHTLTLAIREDNMWVDKFFISSSGAVPLGIGPSGQCPQSFVQSKFGVEINAKILNLKENHLKLFPNPVLDHLSVEYEWFAAEDQEINQLYLVDMLGNTLYSMPLSSNNTGIVQIEVSDFPSGTYMIIIKRDQDVLRKTFIKPD